MLSGSGAFMERELSCWFFVAVGREFLSNRAMVVCSSIHSRKSVKEGVSARSASVILCLNHSFRSDSSRRFTTASMVPGSLRCGMVCGLARCKVSAERQCME